MTVGTGQGETLEDSLPVRAPEGQPSCAWAPARVGEIVGGKYRISRLLAQGGMGLVYEAQHTIVKRRFAVKFLRPELADKRESLGRFQREAEAAGSLESEHIASVVDFGITPEGSAFIVMEYLVGESLASLLKREGPLPVARATGLCIQACHGAEAAHAAGIVHRDLKPHNLFVCQREDRTDLLKILDFGIAKLGPLKNDQASMQTGSVLGTPAYMSPEQARGDKTIDLRTDVYSLGAILFQMLSGQLPHPGDSPNSVLYHISTQPAVSLGAVAPALPKPLVALVDKALAFLPEERPQCAKALAVELARFAGSELAPAAMVASGGKRHRRWLRMIASLIVVAAVGAALLLFGRVRDTTPKATTIVAPEPDRRAAANAAIPPQPARTVSMSSPSSSVGLVASPPSEMPAQIPVKVRAPARARASARPAGSVGAGLTSGSAEIAREVDKAGGLPEGLPPDKPSFPRPAFDPENPYRKP